MNRCGPEDFSWGFALGVVSTMVIGLVTLWAVLWFAVREKQPDPVDDMPP